MSLSDRERRLLAEMEAALASEDPALKDALGKDLGGGTATLLRASSPSLIKGGLLVVIGIATLFGGLIAQFAPVGIFGFLIALTGVVASLKSLSAPRIAAPPKGKGARSGLNSKLQQRWDQRNNESYE